MAERTSEARGAQAAEPAEGVLGQLQRDPGAVGAMYDGWVPDQDQLRREKGSSGTRVVPFDREADLADEELRQQIADLIEVVREPGQSPKEALKAFLKQVLEVPSPADADADHTMERGDPSVYGRSGRAAKGVEVEIEHEGDDEEDEDKKKDEKGKKKEAADAASEILDRFASVLDRMEKRLAALEEAEKARLEAAKTEVRARSGRSLEAERAQVADMVVRQVEPADGIYRRQPQATGDLAGIFAAKAMDAIAAMQSRIEQKTAQEEAIDAITAIQAGLAPVLNNYQLQKIARELGVAYESAVGGFTPDRKGAE